MKETITIYSIIEEVKKDLKKGESKEIMINGNKVIVENMSDYNREKYKDRIEELNNE